MTKKKHDETKSTQDDNTGTYAYDKNLGKVVKVSGRVPSVASKGKGGAFEDSAPSSGCDSCPSGGACGMGGMGGMGGGFGGGF